MLRFWTLFTALALALSAGLLLAADEKAAKEPAKEPTKDAKAEEKAGPKVDDPVGPLKTIKDKVSYSIGLDMGRNFSSRGLDIDPDVLVMGFKDALAEKDKKPLLTDEQMKEVFVAFQERLAKEAMEKEKNAAEKNKKEGDTFLAENKKKQGVVTTASGLQYEVLVEGKGRIPTAKDTVRTHYKGTLLDGTEFDSSFKRGRPASLEVGGVIKGWAEALQLMKSGSKWKLYVPSDLAYGPRGAGGKIGPNAVLIFEIELIDIEE